VLTSDAGVSRVPYIGYKGDYSKLDVVDYIGLASTYAGRAHWNPDRHLPTSISRTIWAPNIGACCLSWLDSVSPE